MNNEELYHYGILGMKWGVRRAHSSPSIMKTGKTSRKSIKDNIKNKLSSNKNRNKSIKKLSDEELRRKINRLQMEQQYANLTRRQQSAGEKFVKQVLYESAKNTASKYVSKQMSNVIDSILEKR